MINSIDILEDGKLSAFTGAVESYLQPEIIVDTLDSLQQLLIKDQFGNYVKADTTITSIKGVAFAGTFADLETAIRDLALESNGLYNGGTGGGGGGGDASAANQVLEIAELTTIVQNTTKSNLEKLKTEANDLIILYTWLDAATADQRIDNIEYRSAALGLIVIDTYTYGGGSGTYYVTSSTLS